jgi:hypothetical protein
MCQYPLEKRNHKGLRSVLNESLDMVAKSGVDECGIKDLVLAEDDKENQTAMRSRASATEF